MHSIESRVVTGPSDILFSGVYVCTFQPRNFTGWGSEGVNSIMKHSFFFFFSQPFLCVCFEEVDEVIEWLYGHPPMMPMQLLLK